MDKKYSTCSDGHDVLDIQRGLSSSTSAVGTYNCGSISSGRSEEEVEEFGEIALIVVLEDEEGKMNMKEVRKKEEKEEEKRI
jgi:hypothetical protein